MKKLLGILASIGLTTATGSAIIISSNEENQLQNEKVKENDEGIPAKGADVTLTLSETKGGELLTETDRLTLQQEIIKQLIEANQGAANVEAETFDFDLSRITTNDKQVFVTVKSTFLEGDKPGLISGTVTVNLTLIPLGQDQVLPNEAHVQLILNETHKTEKLTDNDKTLLQDAVIAGLNKANQNAIVEEDTFEFDLNEITPETEILKVKVNPTDPTADKPGLISTEELDVHLQLTVTFSEAIDPVGSEIQQLQLNSTQKNNQLKEDDQVLLQTEITEKLKVANQSANLENVTFVMDLTNLTPESEKVTVKVNPTASTPDLPGLKAKQVEVNLDLIPANLDQQPAHPTTVVVDLEKTYNDETLKDTDVNLVHDAIIDGMQKANSDAVFDEQTFTVDVTSLTPADTSVQVQVKETESTADKPGLIGEPVDVSLQLNPLYKIVADFQDNPIEEEQTTILSIDNYEVFENLDVKGDEFADAKYNGDGTATISAKLKGTATITVTATNAKPETFQLTITEKNQEKIEILAKLESEKIDINEVTHLIIENKPGELVNLKVEANSDELKIEQQDEKRFIIAPVKDGIFKITITADNAKENIEKLLTVEKTEKGDIHYWISQKTITQMNDEGQYVEVLDYDYWKDREFEISWDAEGTESEVRFFELENYPGAWSYIGWKPGKGKIILKAKDAKITKIEITIIPYPYF